MLGALTVDKPEGITSHTAVARVRKACGTRRVGHAGTLDPFATGVLVVCLGRATRLVQFLAGLDKQYTATVRLGFATDTQDLTGKQITPLASSNNLSEEEVRGVLSEFSGRSLQLPPMYSAKKVAGERLYRAAREGREVERQMIEINIYSIEMAESAEPLRLNPDGTKDFVMRVRCSSGTYIRTLANDIGERLGAGAHLCALRRTAVGHFDLARALTLEEVETRGRDRTIQDSLISPADMLTHLPRVELDGEELKRVVTGRAIELSLTDAPGDWGQSIRLCDERGALVGLGLYDEEMRVVRPKVVLDIDP